MYAVIGMRNYGLKISDTVLVGLSRDFQSLGVVSKLSDKLSAVPAFQEFQKELDTCANSTDSSCFTGAIANLRRRLTDAGITDPDIIDKVNEIQKDANAATLKAAGGDPNANKSFFEKTADTISLLVNPGNAIQHLVELILTGLAIAFFFAIDLAMLLFGLTFPINVALSLFDPAPLKSWFGNFWTLINAKFCFSIITGIIVYLQLWMETNNGNIGIFVIQILLAIFAPVATFFYCQGSALALAGAMNSFPLSPIRGAVGAGTAAGGSFLRGAMQGAKVTPKQFGNRLGTSIAQKWKAR
jgi:hypothetical protein